MYLLDCFWYRKEKVKSEFWLVRIWWDPDPGWFFEGSDPDQGFSWRPDPHSVFFIDGQIRIHDGIFRQRNVNVKRFYYLDKIWYSLNWTNMVTQSSLVEQPALFLKCGSCTWSGSRILRTFKITHGTKAAKKRLLLLHSFRKEV